MATSYRFGLFHLKDGESLWLNDSLLPLSPLQLRLLCCLCRHPQQVLEKDQIVSEVWGRSDVSDVSLARAVHGLRSRLSVGVKPSELIRNVYGRGYILTAPVQCSSGDSPGEELLLEEGLPDGDGPATAALQATAPTRVRGRTGHRTRESALIAG